MGTRGLLGYIRKDGTRKGCYNLYDSYPSGLGKAIADFLRSLKPEELELMAERIEQIEWVQREDMPDVEIKMEYVTSGFHTHETFEGIRYRYGTPEPEQTVEETAACISDWDDLLQGFIRHNWDTLPFIKDGKLRHLIDQIKFLENGLYCEWAYFIDFNKRVVEIHGEGDIVSFETLIAEPEWMEDYGGRDRE